MTLPANPLHSPESPLRRLDPRWKLIALVLATAAVTTVRGFWPLLTALCGAVLLLALGRLPLRWYLSRLGGLALALALFALWLPFLVHDNGPAWDLGPLRVSQYGLLAALRLCLKALTLITLMLVLWATTPPEAAFKAAHALHVPGFLVQLLVLTYRYLFLLVEELGRVRIALHVRGYRNRASLHSYRTVGNVAGTLLVRSYERAERVGQAMRCRGFDGCFRSLTEFHTRGADVAAFVVIVGAAAGLLLWDLSLR